MNETMNREALIFRLGVCRGRFDRKYLKLFDRAIRDLRDMADFRIEHDTVFVYKRSAPSVGEPYPLSEVVADRLWNSRYRYIFKDES